MSALSVNAVEVVTPTVRMSRAWLAGTNLKLPAVVAAPQVSAVDTPFTEVTIPFR